MSIKNDYKPDSTWKTRQTVRYHGLLVVTLVLIGLFGTLLAYISRDKSEGAHPAGPVAKSTPTAQLATDTASQVPAAVKPKYDFYKVLPQRQVEIYRDEITQRTVKQDLRTPTETAAKTASPATSKPALSSAPVPAAAKTPGTASGVEARSSQALPTASSKLASLSGAALSTQQQTAPMTPSSKTGGYFIQVGSFRNYAEADRRKASVAFLGMNARIEAGTGTDGATLHRVRIGPIRDYNQLQILRQRLQENSIPSLPVKIN